MAGTFIDFIYKAQNDGNLGLITQFLRECDKANQADSPQDLEKWFRLEGYAVIEDECKKLMEIQKNALKGAVPDSY